MPIFPCNPINLQDLTNFERLHSGHMVQTFNRDEIPDDYILIKGRKGREKPLNKINEMIANEEV